LIAAATWLVAVLCGFVVVGNHAARAGDSADPGFDWPESSNLVRSKLHPTIVMVVHPHCPCTRASVAALERLLARSRRQADVTAFIFNPSKPAADWTDDSDTVARLRAMKTVRTVVDVDGRLARLFDAKTSGQVLIYGAGGKLRFAGGITSGRGHEGDCESSDAALRTLEAAPPVAVRTEVFGCPIAESSDD
jgi:hypothetical protein